MRTQISAYLEAQFSARVRLRLSLLLLLLLSSPFAHAENARSQESTALEPGKPIEQQISGRQTHSYLIGLTQGQYASIEIVPRGFSASVTLFDGAGEVITKYDVNPTSQADQTIEIVAEATVRYRLEVASKSTDAAARTYTIRLAPPRPASEQDLSADQARRLHFKAATSLSAAKYDEAQALEEKALALRERTQGTESPAVANSLHQLGNIYHVKGDYPNAASAFLRALTIREKASGPESSDVFALLSSLGGLYRDMEEPDKAEQYMRRAMRIQEKLSDLDGQRVAAFFNNFALVYFDKGEYAQAEQLFERTLVIEEKTSGPDSTDVADTLNNLAVVYQSMGDYLQMESALQRALTIYEREAGPDHPDTANTVLNLGNVHYLTGELDQAKPLYERALHSYEKALGPEHPLVALALNNLAEVYHDQHNFTQAEPLYLRSLAIREKKLGANSPDVGQSLNNLGNLYRDEGDYARAQQFYERALTTREQALGAEHPDVVSTLSHMALMYMAQGDFAQAERFQARAIALSERNASLNLLIGSERQKLAYLDSLSEQLDRVITLNVRLAPEQTAARDLALTTVLQRKGRVQDVLSESLASLRGRLSAEDVKLLDRFSEITAQLSRLVLGGPQQLTPEEFQRQISARNDEREKLEAEISRRSAEFRAQSQPVTLTAVRAALPDNAALLEFATYRPLAPKGITSKERYDAPRYVVYVVRNRGEVGWRELGTAQEIDDAVDALRRALRDPQSRDVQQLARAVDEKVMRPVRALLGDAAQLLVSPDGELNLIPFAALIDERGHYLVEQYSFTYLTSGRDLVRMQVARASQSRPLVLANPSFGESTARQTAKVSATREASAPNGRRRSVTDARSLSEVYFAPLEGTAQEAHTIQFLFPDANVLTGAQATKLALKQANAPRLLHIATHGFFLGEETKATANTQGATRGNDASAKVVNPLLRSGLALAGANLREQNDDGILTALEASGLNLWGTKLVVLSACDTGLGEVRNGEGVYGLRRAFVLAGAESLVMSLWPASDYSTRTLMANYYKNLKQGMGRGAALRQVQLDLLKHNPKLHPFYWANFIQSGEWANLDGKR
jgi:CHAT domain-containing protein/Tfp pilus assembly protein PilF